MPGYKKILLLLDLTDPVEHVATAAGELAAAFGAALTILHVVEYMPVEPMGESLIPTAQIEDDLLERARAKLGEIASRLAHPGTVVRVEAGNTKTEILRVAAEESCDLIVLGSRERHGPGILLNLVEDTVLHAAPCDVLAIRMKQ